LYMIPRLVHEEVSGSQAPRWQRNSQAPQWRPTIRPYHQPTLRLRLRPPRYTVGGPAAIWAATWEALGREPFTTWPAQRPLRTSRLHRSHSLAAASSAASTSGTAWFSVSRVPGRGVTSNNRNRASFWPVSRDRPHRSTRDRSASTRSAPSPRASVILGTARCFTARPGGLV